MDLGGRAVVFARAGEMFHEVASCCFPVRAELLASGQVKLVREVWFRVDDEVGVAQLVGPLVLRIREEDGRDIGGGEELAAVEGRDRRPRGERR